jgi:hypothetical protein
MSRAPDVRGRLLLVAGRVQGVPQISFDVQPVGTVASNTTCADVGGSMQPNGLKRMVRLKLIRQTAPEAISFADIDRGIAAVSDMAAEDVDAFDRVVGDSAECV